MTMINYTDQYIEGRQVVIVDEPIFVGNGMDVYNLHIKIIPNPVEIIGHGAFRNCVFEQHNPKVINGEFTQCKFN